MRLGGAVGGLGPTSTAATRNRKSKLFAQYCSLIASIWLLISAVSSSGFSTDSRTRRKGFGNSGKGNGKMLLAILAVLLTAPLASGEWVEPRLMEDAPFKNASSGLVMSTEDSGGSFRVRVEPMTSAVGLGRPETFIEVSTAQLEAHSRTLFFSFWLRCMRIFAAWLARCICIFPCVRRMRRKLDRRHTVILLFIALEVEG